MNKIVTKFQTGQLKKEAFGGASGERSYNRKLARKTSNNKVDLDLDGA